MYGKGHELVEKEMKEVCNFVFYTVKELRQFILNESEA